MKTVAHSFAAFDDDRITDQRGTVRALYYDLLGRLTDDSISTVGGSTDSTVLRISTAYEVRGMVQSITSYDDATPGSGTALNQCQLSYNSFAQLSEEQQEHAGTVTGATPAVSYTYSSADPTSPNQTRLLSITYPNGRVVGYGYGIAGQIDDWLNRVHAILSDGAVIAEYTYLGAGTVVQINYPEPSVWLDLWGGTSGVFNGLDQFNRVIDQRWQNNTSTTPVDIDRYQYGYDRNSNRLWKANVVGTAVVTSGLDELYAYDPLNRLTQMQRGVLNSTKTAITGTPAKEQDWTLDVVGNWPGYLTKTSGTTDLNQSRTSNPVNEITNITESTGPTWVTPAYDAAGNTTTMPQTVDPTQSFTATYDAWNRMTSISDSSGTVASYQYDGRNRRIVSTTSSETRHFYFTTSWQDIEERVGNSTSMDKQYVWGVRYIDELVCRDDATPERLYALQDANFNVTAIAGVDGTVKERYLFDPYGDRMIMSPLWNLITSSTQSWTIAHQGLSEDRESQLICNRRRTIIAPLGRFLLRDPRFYIDGLNLYEYELARPIALLDPLGLGCGCFVPRQPPQILPCPGWFNGMLVWTLDPGTCVEAECEGDCSGMTLWSCELDQGMFDPLPVWRWVEIWRQDLNNCYYPRTLACNDQTGMSPAGGSLGISSLS